jgi:hypothetical protein
METSFGIIHLDRRSTLSTLITQSTQSKSVTGETPTILTATEQMFKFTKRECHGQFVGATGYARLLYAADSEKHPGPVSQEAPQALAAKHSQKQIEK